MLGSHVHVSVLCPGVIRTRIADSARNWPSRLGSLPNEPVSEMSKTFEAYMRSLIEAGMEPAEVADQVFAAVEEDRFWVMPNTEIMSEAIREVAASAVEGRTPPTIPPV